MVTRKLILKNNIQSLREERGWTQEQLAAKLHTTGPQINRLEKSQRKLTVEWLLRLCAAYKVTADKIVNIPLSKAKTSNTDTTLMGSIIGWLIEACDKYKFKPNAKDLGKWSGFVYSEVTEKDLNFKQTKSLAFQIAKLGKQKKK